jgi:hypothetical protein
MLFFLFISITSHGAERFVIPLDKENDLTTEDKIFTIDGIDVAVSVNRPVKPFKPAGFTFFFSDKGSPVKVDRAEIRFNMKMDMGNYVYNLVVRNGKYHAEPILPKCVMGGEHWFGKLTFFINGEEHAKVFFFKVAG